MTITLKKFQEEISDTILAVALDTEDKIVRSPDRRRMIALTQGCLLVEAPTGSGKTITIGHAIDRICKTLSHPVVWFWFAPFAGLVDQTRDALAEHFPTLNVRTPKTDRDIDQIQNGDVFISTWASVAALNKDTRKIRRDRDNEISLDNLIAGLRADGWFVGAVIDEAHHSFRGETQALRFYSEVLRPDLTVLATATPRDRDVAEFKRKTGIADINQMTVSRERVVKARLNKKGIVATTFSPRDKDRELLDTEEIALAAGLRKHRQIGKMLADSGIDLTPLYLVQVDSTENSARRAKEFLIAHGMAPDAIAIHTADEPDKFLHTIAYDENKEVLIFKLAVATGFDAPRAFTLTSIRPSRGVDFGLQILGRIMRVHHRLQPREDLPVELDHGYVFLANRDAQIGMLSAADELKALKDEISTVTDNVILIRVSDGQVAVRQGDGFLDILEDDELAETAGLSTALAEEPAPARALPLQQSLDWITSRVLSRPTSDDRLGALGLRPSRAEPAMPAGGHQYPFRTDCGCPRQLRTEWMPKDQSVLVQHVADCFSVTGEMLNLYNKRSGEVVEEQVEVFTEERHRVRSFYELSPAKVFRQAQHSFTFNDKISPRDLRRALLGKLKKVILNQGWAEPTDEDLKRTLDLIAARYPKAIPQALKTALASLMEVRLSGELPDRIYSPVRLESARKNVYGVFPPHKDAVGGFVSPYLPKFDSSWEVKFAQALDDEDNGAVQWWHRNNDRPGHAVAIVLPDGTNFYPDFIVGVSGRATQDSIGLVEVKRDINDPEGRSVLKVRSRHRDYGTALMVYFDQKNSAWFTVSQDTVGNNYLDKEFEFPILRYV